MESPVKVTFSRSRQSESSIALCAEDTCKGFMQPLGIECKTHNHAKLYRTQSQLIVYTSPPAEDVYKIKPTCPYCGSHDVREWVLYRQKDNWGTCNKCKKGFVIERDL